MVIQQVAQDANGSLVNCMIAESIHIPAMVIEHADGSLANCMIAETTHIPTMVTGRTDGSLVNCMSAETIHADYGYRTCRWLSYGLHGS